MLNNINNWVISILSLGIIITFIELIMPKGKNRKYIYVLIGLLTIVTILSPAIKYITNDEFENNITEAFEEFTVTTSSNYDNVNLVKEQFENNLKDDIISRFKSIKIKVNNIFIKVSEEYVIEYININIDKKEESMLDINKIIDDIVSEYEIEYSNIEVIEEAG